jgi:hypothetical protein
MVMHFMVRNNFIRGTKGATGLPKILSITEMFFQDDQANTHVPFSACHSDLSLSQTLAEIFKVDVTIGLDEEHVIRRVVDGELAVTPLVSLQQPRTASHSNPSSNSNLLQIIQILPNSTL